MVTVRFFGMTRLLLKTNRVDVEARSVEELLEKISAQYKGMSLQELEDSIIFVNGTNMNKLKMLKTTLNNGDVIQVFSPAVGG